MQPPKGQNARQMSRASSMLLRNLDIDEGSSKPYQDQIREALSKNAVRVIDLFREWDEDGDGTVRPHGVPEAHPRPDPDRDPGPLPLPLTR